MLEKKKKKINDLNIHFKKLEKEKQIKHKKLTQVYETENKMYYRENKRDKIKSQ